jgi:hypothetical protein
MRLPMGAKAVQWQDEVLDSLAPSSLLFKSKNEYIFTGRKTLAEADSEFQFDKSLYADDKTKLYESREKLTAGMQIIFTVFKRFGLTCHVVRNGGKSKTEAMFFPPPGVKYEDADLSPIAVHDGEITFTKTFKLLLMILKTMKLLNAGSKVLKVHSLPFKSSSSVQKELRIHTKKLLMKG